MAPRNRLGAGDSWLARPYAVRRHACCRAHPDSDVDTRNREAAGEGLSVRARLDARSHRPRAGATTSKRTWRTVAAYHRGRPTQSATPASSRSRRWCGTTHLVRVRTYVHERTTRRSSRLPRAQPRPVARPLDFRRRESMTPAAPPREQPSACERASARTSKPRSESSRQTQRQPLVASIATGSARPRLLSPATQDRHGL
jgi:hypothetical protein